MKKYKSLTRIFLLSYLVIIFCGVLFGLLLTKASVGLAIALIILAVLDFAALIVVRFLFEKHYNIYFSISVGAIGYMNLSVLGAFIIELIYTIQGNPAPYAWMVSIVSILLTAVIDIFFVLNIRKIHHKKMVELGLEQEEAEEEI